MAARQQAVIRLTGPFSVALEIDRFSESGTEEVGVKPPENSAGQLNKNYENAKRSEKATARHFSISTVNFL